MLVADVIHNLSGILFFQEDLNWHEFKPNPSHELHFNDIPQSRRYILTPLNHDMIF